MVGSRKLSVPLTLPEFIPPAKTALVMWDMQKGLAGKAYNVDQVRERAGALLKAADDAGVLVVWSRHVLPPLQVMSGPFLLFQMRKQKVDHPEKLKPFMMEGMPETAFLDGFKPAAHHIVVEKSQPSLFVDTPLDLRLKSCGIATVVICGVATEIGVEFTARHAQAKGYYTVIAEDACGSYVPENHERSIAFMRAHMPVVSAADVCGVWSKG